MKKRYQIIFLLSILTVLSGCAGHKFTDSTVTPSPDQRITTVSDSAVYPTDRISPSPDPESASEVVPEPYSDLVTESDVDEETIPQISPTPQPTVSIAMVGDILLHTPVEESARREDGSYSFEAIFTHIRSDIEAVDLALVNQEVILGGVDLGISGYPAFNAPFEIGDALANTGFDVICHATNHALDKGKRGLMNSLNFWKESHPDIEVLGIYESAEDRDSIYVYEQNNIKIAILNYTYGTNGISLPEDMPYAVNLLSEDQVVKDLKQAEEIADFTIVCPHWGTEYNLGVSGEQKRWTKLFLKNGADLVLGTHPHVIEPIEWVTDDAGNRMLVYYSLGNFVNWTSGTGEGVANRMVGGMATVSLIKNEDGSVTVSDCGIEPLVCHVTEGQDGVTVYKLTDYTEELASENSIISQDSAFSLTYCRNLCKQVWGDYYSQ